MKTYTIDESAAGQRLDRYLAKLLPKADKNFLQKMIRKKRIKLNGSRAEPADLLREADLIQIYFSEETLAKFSVDYIPEELPEAYASLFNPPLYEDEKLLVVDKPVGLLCQKGQDADTSLIDLALAYLPREVTASATFRPAVANRLDRNTGGVTLIPKTYDTLKAVNAAIRERRAEKIYYAGVAGIIEEPGTLKGFIAKDEEENISVMANADENSKAASLDYEPIAWNRELSATLLAVRLHTGRTHQIRVQFQDMGHPLLGDPKYGDPDLNKALKNRFGLEHQLLFARRYAIPELAMDFTAPLPQAFTRLFPEVE